MMFWVFAVLSVVWALVGYFSNDFYYYITAGIFFMLACATLVWEYFNGRPN